MVLVFVVLVAAAAAANSAWFFYSREIATKATAQRTPPPLTKT